jgi:hypothetical protein
MTMAKLDLGPVPKIFPVVIGFFRFYEAVDGYQGTVTVSIGFFFVGVPSKGTRK